MKPDSRGFGIEMRQLNAELDEDTTLAVLGWGTLEVTRMVLQVVPEE